MMPRTIMFWVQPFIGKTLIRRSKIMALSQTKKKKLREAREREARIEYVKSCTWHPNKPLSVNPFLDYNYDQSAWLYIETGNEALKDFFPKPKE
jgi:hypothetical protein